VHFVGLFLSFKFICRLKPKFIQGRKQKIRMSMTVKSRGVGIVLLGAMIKKTGKVSVNVTLRCLRVTIVAVKEQ